MVNLPAFIIGAMVYVLIIVLIIRRATAPPRQ